MLKLENAQLCLELVDPFADLKLLGSRYCTGGYIFQVRDNIIGDLLSGPTYPDGGFNSFDGQGAPEVFLTALNEEKAAIGEDVCVLGVGTVTRTSPKTPFHVRDNPAVKEFAKWDIDQMAGAITMRTRQVFDKWDTSITRSVSLQERNVESKTNLSNNGRDPLPLRWFPHPFFPFPKNNVACRISGSVSVPNNPGFSINDEGYIELKPGYNWKKGLYQPLIIDNTGIFSAKQLHPLVEKVIVRCNYIPSFIPVWANDNTFSFEPYLETEIKSCDHVTWKIQYEF